MKEKRSSLILLLLFLILATGIVAAGHFSYRNFSKNFRLEIEHQLSSIAELKVGQLVQWRKERLIEASILDRNPAFSVLVSRFLRTPSEAVAQGGLLKWLEKYQSSGQYDRIRLLDPQGLTRLSVPSGLPPESSAVLRLLPEVLQSGRVMLMDFYRDDDDQGIYLSLIVPIFDEPAGLHPVGILALRINPASYIYPYISRWPTFSRTAETLLLRQDGSDVLFLNELKFQKNTALSLRIPLSSEKTPSVMAVLGQEGIVEGLDYRGIPVIADIRHIPDSPWFLVARMDISEVFAPVRLRLWMMIGFIAVLLLGSGIGMGWIQRNQKARFYRERLTAVQNLHAVSSRQEALLSAIPDVVMEVDCNKVYIWANRPGLNFFGEDVIGKEASFYFEGEQDIYKLVGPIFSGREDVIYVESWQRRKDGEKRLLAWWCRVLKDAAGNVTGALSSARDITEQNRADEALRESKHELQARNNELTRFTYAVSHDLKSPLVTVNTFLGYLEQDTGKADPQAVTKDLMYIRNATDKMSRLLDELLELARIGRKTSPAVEVSLQAVVREALTLVAGRIAERGVRVEVTPAPLILAGDRPRLVELFQNLVDNAVKFMGDQPDPRIEIGVVEGGPEPVLFVRDNGIGVDPRHQSKIFGLFEKLDSGTEGTGIGLALVHRIVEVHGGKIRVESAGPGQGTTFFFTLAKTRRYSQEGG